MRDTSERRRGFTSSVPVVSAAHLGRNVATNKPKPQATHPFLSLRASLLPGWSARSLCVAFSGMTSQSHGMQEGEVSPSEEELTSASGKHFKLKELEIPGTILTGANAVGTQVYEVSTGGDAQIRIESNRIE